MVGRRGTRRAAFAIGLAAVVLSAPVRAAGAPCPAVWPPRAPDQTVSLLTTDGLLKLRDIAQPSGVPSAAVLALSPDGRRVAFFVTQQVLDANDTCETLVVLDVDKPDHVQVVDSGGGAIQYEQEIRGMRYSSGVLEANLPVWAPDGSALAFRKRLQGRTQAWIVRLDGSPARQLTHADQDVEAVAWEADGRSVLYSVRPGRTDFAAASAAEARTGYLYDARIAPFLAAEPQLPAELPEVVMTISAQGGEATPAARQEPAALRPPISLTNDLVPARRDDGAVAGAAPIDARMFADQRVFVAGADGIRTDCRNPACTGALRKIWWQGEEVMFLKRDGWYREESVLQAWSPQKDTVRTLLRGQERISDCAAARATILCVTEDARHPRHVIAVDPKTGARREFFDPNPAVNIETLPSVERLRWRNNLGLQAWADLVLPTGTPPPGGWPMVIVQYRSDGFLRGGTGDEYPIFPLAARGIAVFSFQRPDFPPSDYNRADDMPGSVRALHRNWSDRWNVHDSLMRGIDVALSTGKIDPDRIGISGLSDGSTTARFALINHNRFAAASISTCCLEPFNIMTLGGQAVADWFRRMGFPDASRPDPDFWKPASIALNADHIDTPILMQLADTEYIDGLETFTALREHGKPVEMYIFPDEFHDKAQPVHRAAIYERNLDWFSFWLQGLVDPDPVKAEQYQRWEAMKPAREPATSGP